jgi:hypothetical protein
MAQAGVVETLIINMPADAADDSTEIAAPPNESPSTR